MTPFRQTLGAALAFAVLFAAVTAAAETPAQAQANAEAARKAWIKAKNDLQKASGAYDKATEAYIKLLVPAAKPTPKPTPIPTPSGPPQRLVVFTGPAHNTNILLFRALPINYQAQLTVDGKATGWNAVTNELTFRVTPARSLAYEVRRVMPKGGMSGGGRPEYQYASICKGNLAPKDKTTVVIDMNSRCAVR